MADEEYGEGEEISHESGFSRFTNSVGGICVGVVLFFAAFGVLGWNEGRAVADLKTIEEGRKNTVNSACLPDPANNGKLIHFSCDLENLPNQTDDEWGLRTQGVFLKRDSLTYGYKQTTKTTTKKDVAGGGKTTIKTYSCQLQYMAMSTNPETIKCNNIPQNYKTSQFPAFQQPKKFQVETSLTAGGFTLLSGLVDKITSSAQITSPAKFNIGGKMYSDCANVTNKACRVSGGDAFQSNQGVLTPVYTPSSTSRFPTKAPTPATGSQLMPRFGDVQISWYQSTTTKVSVVATQTFDESKKKYEMTPYTADNGGKVYYLAEGTQTAAEMYASAKAGAKAITWILRVVGFAMMWIGLAMMLGPISILADCIPCIGPLLGDLVEGVVCCITFPIAMFFTLVTIAIAWLAYRPQYGIPMLVVAFAIVGGIWYNKSRKQAAKGAEANDNGEGAEMTAMTRV